ncbi:MAG: glutamate--tRNA ligase, partial [Acholeplasmataceae bacterium]|nr:glutamate--tRNA ligase [Acholeplasmataceae bacterium]
FTPDAAELLSACLKSLNLLEDFTLPAMEKTYAEIAENKGIALGKLIHPTRLALTGRMVSPGLFDVMLLLGREKTIKRLQNAINYINSR